MVLHKKSPVKWGFLYWITLVFICAHVQAFAASNRIKGRVGIYGAILGEPHPSSLSAGLFWNIFDFLRVQAGAGTAIIWNTAGAGAKLFIPGLSFSPFVGYSYAKVSGGLMSTIKTKPYSHQYYTAGLEYCSPDSVFIGVGWSQPQSRKDRMIGMPFFYAGIGF